jgi:hypothetical protein
MVSVGRAPRILTVSLRGKRSVKEGLSDQTSGLYIHGEKVAVN